MTSNNLQSKLPMTIGMALILIAIGYYFYTSGGSQVSDQQSLSFDVASAGQGGVPGSDILNLLKKIHQLNIDYKFFDPQATTPLAQAEQSLFDFSQPIPPENIGRPNPFLPIGAAAVQQANNATNTLAVPPIPGLKKK
jgi:hypothetical protein